MEVDAGADSDSSGEDLPPFKGGVQDLAAAAKRAQAAAEKAAAQERETATRKRARDVAARAAARARAARAAQVAALKRIQKSGNAAGKFKKTPKSRASAEGGLAVRAVDHARNVWKTPEAASVEALDAYEQSTWLLADSPTLWAWQGLSDPFYRVATAATPSDAMLAMMLESSKVERFFDYLKHSITQDAEGDSFAQVRTQPVPDAALRLSRRLFRDVFTRDAITDARVNAAALCVLSMAGMVLKCTGRLSRESVVDNPCCRYSIRQTAGAAIPDNSRWKVPILTCIDQYFTTYC